MRILPKPVPNNSKVGLILKKIILKKVLNSADLEYSKLVLNEQRKFGYLLDGDRNIFLSHKQISLIQKYINET